MIFLVIQRKTEAIGALLILLSNKLLVINIDIIMCPLNKNVSPNCIKHVYEIKQTMVHS